MDNKHKRILLFLIGCMGTRYGLAYLAYKYTNWLRFMGYLALIPAIGFMIIYLGGYRKTGPEVFGDVIWWNNLRPVHAALYFTFAYLAITGVHQHAWKILALDATIGLVAFVYKQVSN